MFPHVPHDLRRGRSTGPIAVRRERESELHEMARGLHDVAVDFTSAVLFNTDLVSYKANYPQVPMIAFRIRSRRLLRFAKEALAVGGLYQATNHDKNLARRTFKLLNDFCDVLAGADDQIVRVHVREIFSAMREGVVVMRNCVADVSNESRDSLADPAVKEFVMAAWREVDGFLVIFEDLSSDCMTLFEELFVERGRFRLRR